MCINDNVGRPCDDYCGHLKAVMRLETLEEIFRERMPVPRMICVEFMLDDVMKRCEDARKALLCSQTEIEESFLSLEREIRKLKHPTPTHTVISAQDLVNSLYGLHPKFSYSLRLESVLPKVLYRFKPYRIVMELKAREETGMNSLISTQFRIAPYSSKMPVKALDVSLITFDSVKLSVNGSRVRVEIINVKFQFTTKGCDFNHICLVIMHASEAVKPVVLEGVHIRARKKIQQSD